MKIHGEPGHWYSFSIFLFHPYYCSFNLRWSHFRFIKRVLFKSWVIIIMFGHFIVNWNCKKELLLFISSQKMIFHSVWFLVMVLIRFLTFSGGEGFTYSHFVTLRTDSYSKCFVSCQTGEFPSWSQEWHHQGQSLFPLYKNQVHVVFKSPTSMSAVPAKRLLQMHFQGMDLSSTLLQSLFFCPKINFAKTYCIKKNQEKICGNSKY